MDRQEYPAMLATLQPGQAIDVLHDRVKQVGSLNAHIADWLQERKRLEEQYSSGLRKLARRPPPGDANELGIFSVPWSTLTNALESMAESHHAFANNIETDVEKPLRNFAFQNREMQAMSTIQGNLASLARDIDNAEKKNERLAHKGQKAKTQNVANASSDLETATSQWDNQAPYVFEQLQAVDETRLNQLRDALTQFQTHEVDRIEKDRALAEQCLNVILNVETTDEIKTFALRITQGGGARPVTTRENSRRQSSFLGGPSTPSFAAAPASHASHNADDASSQRSGSLQAEPEKKSGLKGLKRLGTVLGRRRESKIMLPTRGASESPERKEKSGSSAFNTFSSRFGRGRDLPTPLEDEESPPGTASPLRTITSASAGEPPAIDGSAQSLAAAGMLPNGHDTPTRPHTTQTQAPQGHLGDVALLQEPLQPSTAHPIQPASREFEPPRDAEGYTVPPPHIDAISQAEREAADENASPAYNVNIRQAPIAEEGSDDALASMANTLKMQGPPPTSRRQGTIRGRRDVRASVYAPVATPEPVIEESVSSSPNMGPPASTTRELDSAFSPSPAALPVAPAPISTQALSSRPLSPFSANSPGAAATSPTSPGFSSFSASRSGDHSFSPYHGSAAATAAAIFRPGSSIGQGMEHDAHSIRSGRSLSSTTSQGASKHPDLHSTGLNSSIIETVSAWFEHGLCTRSVVIGEVALAYNAADFNSPFGQETIRLEGFEKLEKVAPNPAFISDSAAKGEYSVNLSHIQKTNVAFKYQLAPSAGAFAGEHAPLLLNTAWKIQAGTAMCIVSYSLNPSFALPPGSDGSVFLQNVTLILHLDPVGAKAQSCQSKPVGTFDRTRNLIYWTLGDITLSSQPQKALAKFVTPDGEVKAGHLEAKWELTGGPGVGAAGSGLQVQIRDEGAGEADPFADERSSTDTTWKGVEGHRKVVAGTYHAQ